VAAREGCEPSDDGDMTASEPLRADQAEGADLMPAYMIVQIKITREDGWPEYREQVSRLFAAHGGTSSEVVKSRCLRARTTAAASSFSSFPRWKSSARSGTRPNTRGSRSCARARGSWTCGRCRAFPDQKASPGVPFRSTTTGAPLPLRKRSAGVPEVEPPPPPWPRRETGRGGTFACAVVSSRPAATNSDATLRPGNTRPTSSAGALSR
jgi:hypothetical protein